VAEPIARDRIAELAREHSFADFAEQFAALAPSLRLLYVDAASPPTTSA
jgi:hypothetical protein